MVQVSSHAIMIAKALAIIQYAVAQAPLFHIVWDSCLPACVQLQVVKIFLQIGNILMQLDSMHQSAFMASSVT